MNQKSINKLENLGDVATNIATNGMLAFGAFEGIKYLDKLDYGTATQTLFAGAAALGIHYLNKKKVIENLSKKVNNYARNIKGQAMPIVRNVVLAGYLTGAAAGIGSSAKEIYKDFYNHNYNNIENIIDNEKKDKFKVKNSRFTTQGKFERTYRWDNIIDKAEEKYDIEKGLLAGLIMRESYGNPVQLNRTDDGGAGLMMFQPGTARDHGLKVYGDSNKTGKDLNHGKELKELAEDYNYNYELLKEIDERFSIPKSIDAGAKFLSNLKKRHGDWDSALSAYNKGKPAKSPETTDHVKMVRLYQDFYNTHDTN